MKLILLSDTHGLLRPQVLEHLMAAEAADGKITIPHEVP